MSELHKFLFDGMPVRGMLVRLDSDWQAVQSARKTPLPTPVNHLLGEMAAAALLMQANIKFEGQLVLQIAGDGPVPLAVAETQSDLQFRVTARVQGAIAADASLTSLINSQGLGRCAVSLVPSSAAQQTYQGVVPLHNSENQALTTLAHMVEHYMAQSEQLQTKLVLAANEQTAAGILIQRMPAAGAGNLDALGKAENLQEQYDEDWRRIALLAASLKTEELLSLDFDTILHRLFWQEPHQRYTPLKPRFACRCSLERVKGMLQSLGAPEVESIIFERGHIAIDCDFCGQQYQFNPIEAAQIFLTLPTQTPASAVRH